MDTSCEYTVEKPALQALLEVLSQCGQVVSVFLNPQPPVRPKPLDAHPLSELFACGAFQTATHKLGQVSATLGRYSTLNRLEFEGSLVSVVLAGGCHCSTSGISQHEARSLVAGALAAVFPEPFDDLLVFRLDNEAWCPLAAESTVSSSFVAWQSPRNLWWVLCVADSD
jgi:hypothetical protein